MRIIVMSDTHRNYSSLEKIIRIHPNADMYIHLGDGEEDVNLAVTRFRILLPDSAIYAETAITTASVPILILLTPKDTEFLLRTDILCL